MKEGEILKMRISESGMTATEVAEKIRCARETLYFLYKRDKIKDSYKEKLAKIGITLTEKPKNIALEESALQKKIAELEREVVHQKEIIDLLRQQVALYAAILKER